MFQFLKKIPPFGIHCIVYITLCVIVIFNIVPTILLTPSFSPARPEKVGVGSTYFNAFFEKDDSLYTNNTLRSDLIKVVPYGHDLYGEHHEMLSVYRAVRTGIPLSNLGYNDSALESTHEKTNIQDLTNKRIYTSSFNNFAELAYYSMPYKYADTKEKMIANAEYMLKVRYILAFIHVLGFVLIFILCLKYLGSITAWIVGGSLLLYPATLIAGIFSYGYTSSLLAFMAFVLYFYQKILESPKKRNHLIFGILFIGLSCLGFWLDSLRFILYTWAPAVVAAFILELYKIYDNPNKIIRQLSTGIVRISIFTGISLILCAFIYFKEQQQMIAWYGEGVINSSEQRLSQVIMADASLKNIGDWLYHILRSIKHHIFTPMSLPDLWMYKFNSRVLYSIPPIFRNISFFEGSILILILSFFIGKKLEFQKPFQDIIQKFKIATGCYILFFLLFTIILPRMMYHYHMFLYNLMIYQVLIITMLLGQVLTLFFNNYRIKWTFMEFVKK